MIAVLIILGLELGLGDGALMQAIPQTTGRSVAQIRADVSTLGDLGLVAEANRGKQKTMLQPPLLTLRGIIMYSNQVEVDLSEFPYIVSIQVNQAHKCGGIIFDESTVLTDCQDLFHGKEDITVVAGRTRAENKSPGDQVLKVNNQVAFNLVEQETLKRELVILTTRRKFVWSRFVQPAVGRLQTNWDSAENETFSTVGWNCWSGKRWRCVLYKTTSIRNDSACASVYKNYYKTPTQLCVLRKSCLSDNFDYPVVLVNTKSEVIGIALLYNTPVKCKEKADIYLNLTYYNDQMKRFLEVFQTTFTEVPVSNFTSPPLETASPTIIITILCLATLFLLLTTCFLLLRKKLHRIKAKRMQPRKTSFDKEVLGEESTKSQTFKRYRSWVRGEINTSWRNLEVPDDAWEVSRDDIIMVKLIGEGFFGQVWKCEASRIKGLKEPTVAAVKTIKEIACKKERDALLAEIQVMKELERHSNIISLFGCCTEKDPVLLIMEYVNGGSLLECLRRWRSERESRSQSRCSGAEFASNDVIIFSHQIANGMEFLTSQSIVHRDLAARNVLLDTSNMICKIADFGLARVTKTDRVSEKKSDGLLPIRWLAPESLADGVYTTKSDVWSFGILVWEIVTLGSTPYPGMSAGDVMTRVKNGYRLERPEHCKDELYRIMLICWEVNPVARPTFAQLVKRFDKLICSEMDYVDLNSFLDCSYYNVITQSSDEKI